MISKLTSGVRREAPFACRPRLWPLGW